MLLDRVGVSKAVHRLHRLRGSERAVSPVADRRRKTERLRPPRLASVVRTRSPFLDPSV